MHLLVFNRSYHPDPAATGQLLTELCEDLVTVHGHRVTVVCGEVASSAPVRGLWRRELRGGVRILRARGSRWDKRIAWRRFANYLSYWTSALLAGLGARRVDLVVSLTDPPIVGLAGLLNAALRRVPFVYLCQDVFPEVAVLLEDFRSRRLERLLERITRLLLRRADAVVAIGETMKGRLVTKGAAPEKVAVIHNWADLEALGPEPKDNWFSRGHGLEERFVVMHSGNQGLSQGLEVLIEAAARLQDLEDLVVVFQGEGVKHQELRQRVARLGLENVLFLPVAPKATLRYSLGSADLQIISLKRGLAGFIVPSKLYGILAAGKPYVAAVEPNSEVAVLTARHCSGLVVDAEDPMALAQAIRRLHANQELRDTLGANARAAAAGFDRKLAVEQYHQVFSRLAPGVQSAHAIADLEHSAVR
jgi:glycosyltransferase involved in cell wall biosynthesis